MFKRLPILLFVILFCKTIFAQQYNFHNYSVADGLAQSQVYAMAEDPRGYLWLGTQGGGLSRFDGLQFKTFTEDDGLPNAFIRSLKVDLKGNIWIGTDEGAVWYDGVNFNPLKFPGSYGTINDFWFGKDSSVYVATGDSGLVVLKNNRLVEHFLIGNGLSSNTVFCIAGGINNEIWIGTQQGACRISNHKAKSFGKNEGFPTGQIRSILKDKSNTIWFATYGFGLLKWKNNQVEKFTVDDGLSTNSVQCIVLDQLGRIWAGTSSGVSRIDGVQVKQFSEREGLCSNSVMSLLEDSWGNIWFGTSGGGACKLDGERFIHFNEKSGDMGTWVYALHCDRKGHLWFGTSRGGVTEYDGTYYTNYYQGAGFTTYKVKSISEDSTGTMWFGTEGDGAYCLQNGSFKHLTRSMGLSGNFVKAFLTDSFHREWMATAGGEISIWNNTNEKFEHIGKNNGITSPRIFTMANDHAGNIYVGSEGGGVYLMRYDSTGTSVKKQYTTKDGLPNDFVRCATCDRFGNMWFGTKGNGVSRLASGKFTNYSTKNGLASNNIYVLIADQNGNIWVGSEKGLDKISYDKDGTILNIKHYGKGEGLIGIETSQNAGCLDTLKRVWFGTINGASVYNFSNDIENKEPPKIHLTGIRLFFDPIENTSYWNQGKNKNWFPIPDSLELPYTQNHLRFEFTGIDLRNPEGVRFHWRLIGFDKKWSPENNERQATYSNLPPGDYVFEVEAKNADGYWSSTQRFVFKITPPIWATWPFRIVVGIFILLLIGIVFYWQASRIKKKTKEQLEKVTLEKHVLELEQKALRLQMNPHFIFNALQSIQGFIARNDSAEARRYLAKFGKLMRSTLENSRHTYTSIGLETESLSNYLGLEALCHGNRFTFTIETDQWIDPEATFIPVMLIQPFVENAVIHGLLHQQEKAGKIDIRFILDGKSVLCEIEDNGVGRAKAKEFESRTKKDHQSAALEITRERLAQANEKNLPESKLEIIDLMDETGIAKGTKVVITIGNVVFE